MAAHRKLRTRLRRTRANQIQTLNKKQGNKFRPAGPVATAVQAGGLSFENQYKVKIPNA
jgi:hypothetical protein